MNSAIDRLQTLRVADAMSAPVKTISSHASMSEAARVMCRHNIRGVPVVDEQGRCVGMLTTTDYVVRENRNCDAANAFLQDDYRVRHDDGNDPIHIDYCPEGRVEQHMTSAVQSIEQHHTLLEAAKYMSAEHVHRLVVLDHSARPVGIITSLDLVSAIIASVEK